MQALQTSSQVSLVLAMRKYSLLNYGAYTELVDKDEDLDEEDA